LFHYHLPHLLAAASITSTSKSIPVHAVLQAVEAGCVPVLLGLVTAASAAQACAAAGALMMVSLSKQAKVALHEVRHAGAACLQVGSGRLAAEAGCMAL
jgi:hypothetical protein